jgi:hypothetical protein
MEKTANYSKLSLKMSYINNYQVNIITYIIIKNNGKIITKGTPSKEFAKPSAILGAAI